MESWNNLSHPLVVDVWGVWNIKEWQGKISESQNPAVATSLLFYYYYYFTPKETVSFLLISKEGGGKMGEWCWPQSQEVVSHGSGHLWTGWSWKSLPILCTSELVILEEPSTPKLEPLLLFYKQLSLSLRLPMLLSQTVFPDSPTATPHVSQAMAN